MIACPGCGGEMRVTETRTVDQYVRRRRECPKLACRARVTTAEIIVAVDDGRNKPLGDVIIMPRKDVVDVLNKLGAGLSRRYGTKAVLEMLTAVLPSETTTEKGTDNANGNDHGDGNEQPG